MARTQDHVTSNEYISISDIIKRAYISHVTKLQNRAACIIIIGSSWDARSGPILHALKRNSLVDRRAKQLKSLTLKTVNNLLPEYLSDKFTSVNTIHRHAHFCSERIRDVWVQGR